MKKQLLTLFSVIFFSAAFGQVGINTATPNAQLDIRSSNQATPSNTDGILIPKIDAFPVTNPTSAQNGMMVFLTTTVGIKSPGFYYWDSATSTWIGLAAPTSGWELIGNSGTVAGTNFIGTTDNQAIDFRTNNILRTWVTTKGQIETFNTGNSVFIGEGAGANDDLTDNRNILIGLNAGQISTASNFNTGIGYQALQNNVSNGATAVGYNALQNYTGIRGTAVGYEALKLTTTGSSNTAVGYAALTRNTTGGNNTAVGNETLANISTGSNNSGFGKYALLFSTTAFQNSAVGVSALHTNTTGASNTSMGFQSMGLNTTGNNNVALGYQAMYDNSTGSNNMALGSSANVGSAALTNASAIGYNAKVNASNSMVLGGTGADAVKVGIGTVVPAEELEVVGDVRTSSLAGTGTRMVQADSNGTLTPLATGTASQVLLGTGVWGSVPGVTNDWSLAGNSGTTPGTDFIGTADATDFVFKTNNTERARFLSTGFLGIGTTAPNQQLELTGNFRLPASTATSGIIYAGNNRFAHNFRGTFLGISAGNLAATGVFNVGVGSGVLQNMTSGNYNVGVGANALSASTSGFSNTALGYQTMQNAITAGDNTAVGSGAMRNLTAGARNIAVGSQAMGANLTASDNVAIGYGTLSGALTGGFNTAVGNSAMSSNTSGFNNAAFGREAMQLNTTGGQNTAIGRGALYSNTTGGSNTVVGHDAGHDATGSGNVFLGYLAGYFETGNNKLYIDNSNTTIPLVYGDFSTNLLRVNGTLNINNTYSLPTTDGTAGQSLTTDGAGVVSWSNGTADNMGNHTATQNVQLNNNYLSNDGDNEGIVIDNAGNVGVATAAPSAKLHVTGNTKIENGTLTLYSNDSADKIQLTDWADMGSKINHSVGWSIDYMAGPGDWDTDGYHRFFTSVSGVGYVERMRVNNNGNVGIGSTSPTQAKLVINGTENNTLSYGYLLSDGTVGANSGTAGYSVYASGRIAATEFNAFSDERIKNIKGISNSSKDLETLNKIQITDYTFKDSIGKGLGTNKKVIAQQVQKVYPQAVSEITDVIPDIYTIAKIKDGRVILKNSLQKGDRVKLILENRTEIVDVLQADEYGFNVAVKEEGKVFVFGREVKDFHTVDYEALSTLNISATQELIKIINQQESQIRGLKAENDNMNKRLSQTEADINQIKSMFDSTVSSNSK